jgi:dTDP-4-dehydrorhamnose reductase
MKARTLLVTGAQGFVAGSILRHAPADWEVHAVSRSEAPACSAPTWQWHQCNFEKPDALHHVFEQVRPAAVIHTAALADIDFCQSHQVLARKANVELTRTLVQLCAGFNTKLVFCSTDTIFDGEHAPYAEDSSPGPLNFYAETKVEAENVVKTLGPLGMIARLSLVVGMPMLGAGNSFVSKVVGNLSAGRTVAVPKEEIRTPIDIITAGRALIELAAGTHAGIWHLAGKTSINRLDLTRAIAGQFSLPRNLVTDQVVPNVPGRAPRPRDVSLSNDKARSLLATPMLDLPDALKLISGFKV